MPSSARLSNAVDDDEPLDAPPVPWLHGIAGISSGAISMSLFYPLDMLRTRMHTIDGKRRLNTIAEICKQEGVKGMYRGVGVAVGSHSIGWGMYLSLFKTCQNQTVAWNGGASTGGDFMSACVAATITATTVTPLNLLKVRTQLAKSGRREMPPKGVVRGLKHIARTEGFATLFNGLGPQILLSSHTTIQVALYECIKREVWGKGRIGRAGGDSSSSSSTTSSTDDSAASTTTDIPLYGVALASGFSKAVASAICNPLEVVRTRTQDQKSRGRLDYKSMGVAFKTLWREEGLKGMYRGVIVNMCRVVPTTVVAFVLYESFIKVFHPNKKVAANK